MSADKAVMIHHAANAGLVRLPDGRVGVLKGVHPRRSVALVVVAGRHHRYPWTDLELVEAP